MITSGNTILEKSKRSDAVKAFQKMGGISSLICAATFLLCMGLIVTLLTPMAKTDMAFVQFMAFFMNNQTIIFIWHLIMYMVHGVFLVILALALHDRLKTSSPAMSQVATAFGLFWAVMIFASGFIVLYGCDVLASLYGKDPTQAATLKLVLDTVTLGLDHSDRFLGCLWVLLISCAAFRSGEFPKALNYFGLVIGLPSIISTFIPAATELASYIFGLGIIVWYLWLGIVLLRSNRPL